MSETLHLLMSVQWRSPRLAGNALLRQEVQLLGRTFVSQSDSYPLTINDYTSRLVDTLPPPHPRGTPGAGKSLIHSVFDASKARKVLGIDFRNIDEMVKDTEMALRKRGWGVAA
jgi:hypothetical protein